MSLPKRLKLLEGARDRTVPVALADGKNMWEIMTSGKYPVDVGVVLYEHLQGNKRIFYTNQ